MDFKLDIGELTNTIRDYENTIKTLAEQKENINKTVKELTDLGWSGAAKDQFEQNHSKKQEFYTKLEEDFKYVENAMERDEKPEAVKLKKRCEGFEACIKRSAGGAALTHDDVGTISLQYGGQALINNNVDECINNHYKKMDSKFVEIQNLVNSLTFTSFPIGEDIEKARKSLKDQTTSLTDFNDSFNEYCSGVKTMESNICSVFGKISGITEGISKLRGVSVISEGGQVDKDKVKQLMLKNPSGLTNEEKEMLAYLEKVLGEKRYAELKNKVVEGNKPITFDDVATSPWTSGVLGGIDKHIGQKIDGMTYNQLSEKLKQFGYDRTYRRNLMRSVTKKFGDLKIGDELPKGGEFELPNGLKLAKGFGVASTALAGVTAVEDVKNNDTGLHRAEAIGIDGVGTAAGYFATIALTDGAAVGVTGYVAAGVTAVAGVFLAPEIAAGVGVAVAGVAVAGAACGIASWVASKVKTRAGLK
jgi:uncharacterized protein YukE